MIKSFFAGFSATKKIFCASLILLSLTGFSTTLQATPKNQSSSKEVVKQITVAGQVIDEKSQPIAGASVILRSENKGTSTDAKGFFSIKCKEGAVIEVSMIGFYPKKLKAAPNMKIILKENKQQLNEVVLVGYGSQKKINLTGAVANIDVKKSIGDRPITDVGRALQGVSPGLTISNKNGGVGTEATIHLRGAVGSLSSIGTGTRPLILLDNVEIPSLNLINPADIESISVLKDAASSSIYGTRAAWGVILITSKKGHRNEKVRLSYSSNFAWSTPTKMAVQASTIDNARFILDVAKRIGKTSVTNIGYTVDASLIPKLKEWNEKYAATADCLGEMKLGRDFEFRGGKLYFYRSFNPIEQFTQKWAPQQNHELSISGGSAKTNYNISMSVLDQKGVLRFNTDYYRRYTLNSSINTDITKFWTFKTNLMFTHSDNVQPYKYTSGYADVWYYLLRWPRWYPYADYQSKPFRSAVTEIKQANKENLATNYIRANIGSILRPFSDLTINVDYTFSLTALSQKRNGGKVFAYNMFSANPLAHYTDIYGASHNKVVQTSSNNWTNIFKAYATYNHIFAEKHNIKIISGLDAEYREGLGQYSERRGLLSTNYPAFSLATGDEFSYNPYYSFNTSYASMGVFTRLNYNYDQRYLLELNARYDASSLFPEGRKWGFFPSASVGWRISQEAFMENLRDQISNLKLRLSWGSIGNQNVAPYSYLSVMKTAKSNWILNNKNSYYITSPTVVSPNLTWETVSTLDLGLDLALFENRIQFTADYYHRITSNMHSVGKQLPRTFGATPPKMNFGALSAEGLELSLSYKDRLANGLSYNMAANFSCGKEYISKYNSSDKNIYGNYQGKVLGEIWGYKTDRFFTKDDFTEGEKGSLVLKKGIPSQKLYENHGFVYGPGDVKYKDINHDGEITYGSNTVSDHGDLSVIGNYLPNYEYSFSFGLNYKNWDFSVLFQGVGKKDYWAYGAIAIPGGGSSYADALYAHQTDYWTEDNPHAFYPRPFNMAWKSNNYNFLVQTKYLSNMAYLRCKNLSIAYSIPESIISRFNLTQLRFYFSAENLFEFDHMKIPLDPEATAYKPGSGDDTWSFGRAYPISRTLSVGLQLSF